MNRRSFVFSTAVFAGLLELVPDARAGADAKQWNDSVDKAVAYLRKQQNDDGSWGKTDQEKVGITGLILTGLLQSGKVGTDDPMVDKGLKYIESLINPRERHIAGKDPRMQLKNYVTCINVLALVSAKRDSYKAAIADAAKFLRTLQWDEGEGKDPEDDFYGGAGYDSKSRPDMSNTQFYLDALTAAGIPKDDPAFKKAAIFVSRCQNFKGENNDRKWANKINDGSFIYSAAGGGQTKTQDEANGDGGLPGYGSMTYAGIKSLIYCGVSKDDPRIKKAFEWIQKNYTVDANPGMPELRKHWGLYYYYHTMAKCLDTLGLDKVKDAAGKEHDWRADITAALAKRQQADGSWRNDNTHWMEGNPLIVTGYALMALSYCKEKK
ncbi:MAG TPA: prenyltransferase/squalene oxidase repeat-containing protein [Gemmataceae bacterium]|nr:prenyltransferase/squalene oxidase repeat-containing protein [Gemmataceae bacterium]